MNRNNEPSSRNGDFYEVIKHTGVYIVISLAVYILSALLLNFVVAIAPALCVFLLLFLTDEVREVKIQNKQLNQKLIEIQKTLDEMKCGTGEN